MLDDLDRLIADFEAAPAATRKQVVAVLLDTGEKVANTQRQRTRSTTTRDKITVRPSRSGQSVWVGPSYTDPDEPNLSWIEEYGTSRQPPHPFIEGSELPHLDGMVEGLAKAVGDIL